jgi:hypothetical protein
MALSICAARRLEPRKPAHVLAPRPARVELAQPAARYLERLVDRLELPNQQAAL